MISRPALEETPLIRSYQKNFKSTVAIMEESDPFGFHRPNSEKE